MNEASAPAPPPGEGTSAAQGENLPHGTVSPAAPATIATPLPIPDHELLRCIGSGAYGEVWLARTVPGELRAVKVIHRGRFSDPRPFEREFEGIQRFEPISRSHPSQLAIFSRQLKRTRLDRFSERRSKPFS